LKEKHIRVDLKPFFRFWVTEGNLEIVKSMLDLDPSLINQFRDHLSYFTTATLKGRSSHGREMIDMLNKVIADQGLSLS